VANRFGANHAQEIDDAMQEICLKLSNQARLDRFPDTDDAMLEAYLKATIANAAHDYFRAQRAQRRDVTVTRPIDENFPMAAYATSATDADRRLLLSQIENLVAGSDRDKCIFFLYYREGWTAKEIAHIPSLGLAAKGVESLVFRMASVLRAKLGKPAGSEGFSQGRA